MVKIDPGKLDPSLLHLPRDLPKAPALKGEHIGKRMYVPYLEAIYRAPVPASTFVGFCVAAFAGGNKLLWQEVPVTPSAHGTISEIAKAWMEENGR